MSDHKANAQPPVLAIEAYPWICILCIRRNFTFFSQPYPICLLTVSAFACRYLLKFDMCFRKLDFYIVLIKTEVSVFLTAELWMIVHIIYRQLFADAGVVGNLFR